MRNFPESCGWSPMTTMHEVLDKTPAPKPKQQKPLRATILKDRWAVLHFQNLAVNHLSPSPLTNLFLLLTESLVRSHRTL